MGLKSYVFTCNGHPNIRAKHTKTLEFTKDKDITISADCIIGVEANFELEELKKLSNKIRIILQIDDLIEKFTAYVNPNFNHNSEMVLRRSRYNSPRTFAFHTSKTAIGLKRAFVEKLKSSDCIMQITIEELKDKRRF